MTEALAGCTVVVTREHEGELGRMLRAAGANVEHVPLIEIVDVEAERARALNAAIAAPPDWVIVTSAAGAERVGEVADQPSIRLAAVGTATASRLAAVVGRPVDVQPERQIATSLVDAFTERVPAPQRVLIAQGDLAADDLRRGLEAAGHHVEVHVAYRTRPRVPTAAERERAASADAVVFASGSSARAWADALGPEAQRSLPPLVVAIGPTTTGVATRSGLKITHEAAEHSLMGVVAELSAAWCDRDRR